MNEKDFVNLKVARKLKEKGFDEYCKALYIHRKWSDISCKKWAYIKDLIPTED